MATRRRRSWGRRVLWLLPLMLVAAAAALWIWPEYFATLPDLAAIGHVQPGMTDAEVIRLFGAKPATKRPTQFGRLITSKMGGADTLTTWTHKYWYCDAGIVQVNFGPDARVLNAFHVGYSTAPSPLRLKLRRFLQTIGLGWLGV